MQCDENGETVTILHYNCYTNLAVYHPQLTVQTQNVQHKYSTANKTRWKQLTNITFSMPISGLREGGGGDLSI